MIDLQPVSQHAKEQMAGQVRGRDFELRLQAQLSREANDCSLVPQDAMQGPGPISTANYLDKNPKSLLRSDRGVASRPQGEKDHFCFANTQGQVAAGGCLRAGHRRLKAQRQIPGIGVVE